MPCPAFACLEQGRRTGGGGAGPLLACAAHSVPAWPLGWLTDSHARLAGTQEQLPLGYVRLRRAGSRAPASSRVASGPAARVRAANLETFVTPPALPNAASQASQAGPLGLGARQAGTGQHTVSFGVLIRRKMASSIKQAQLGLMGVFLQQPHQHQHSIFLEEFPQISSWAGKQASLVGNFKFSKVSPVGDKNKTFNCLIFVYLWNPPAHEVAPKLHPLWL